mgnify:CR=1 FL=1
MNAEQISYGQTLDIARHLLPVMLSRTALKIFPKWKTADMSSKQIVAVICRNLLFYQIQLMFELDGISFLCVSITKISAAGK